MKLSKSHSNFMLELLVPNELGLNSQQNHNYNDFKRFAAKFEFEKNVICLHIDFLCIEVIAGKHLTNR